MESKSLWVRGLNMTNSTNDWSSALLSWVPLLCPLVKCVMLWNFMVEILMCIFILLIECEKCCECCVSTYLKSMFFIAIMVIHILLKWEVNCKSDDDVAFVMHFVLHDSVYCLVWANITCIKILQNLIMVQVCI